MALERLDLAVSPCGAVEASRLGLGSVDDWGADVGLQGEIDVHQAELVAVASCRAGVVLATGEVADVS
jgi:hypothetical protein